MKKVVCYTNILMVILFIAILATGLIAADKELDERIDISEISYDTSNNIDIYIEFSQTESSEIKINDETDLNNSDISSESSEVITSEDIEEITSKEETSIEESEITRSPLNAEYEDPDIDITVETDRYHIIQSGDNFWSLSKKYYGDGKYTKALMQINNFEDGDILHGGDKIKIPSLENKEFIAVYEAIENSEKEAINTFLETVKGTTIQAGSNHSYVHCERMDPAVDIYVPDDGESMKNYTGYVDTSNFELLGNWSTTGYTPQCIHCCGSDKGIGASGVPMICGYSVAAPDGIPFGTTLYIEGYGFYVVEDRGNFGNSNIDIACPSHDACGEVTAKNVNIYIVPNN